MKRLTKEAMEKIICLIFEDTSALHSEMAVRQRENEAPRLHQGMDERSRMEETEKGGR